MLLVKTVLVVALACSKRQERQSISGVITNPTNRLRIDKVGVEPGCEPRTRGMQDTSNVPKWYRFPYLLSMQP